MWCLRRARSGTILVMSDRSGSDSSFCERDLKFFEEDRLLRLLDGQIGGTCRARVLFGGGGVGHSGLSFPLLRLLIQDLSGQNISHAPTKAVAKAFGVKDRMASTYVDKARKAAR